MKNKGMTVTDSSFDVGKLLNGTLTNFLESQNENVYQILNGDPEWKKLQTQEEIFERFLKDYFGAGNVCDDLSEVESTLRYMYGNACYLQGIRDGINFMLWATGKKEPEAGTLKL